jgi:hypothetical protein
MVTSKRILWLFAAGGLTLAAWGRKPRLAPLPSDPLEIVNGEIQVADTPASREAAIQLLARARNRYALRNAARGYDLKVSFTVNSGGQTDHDGAWQMEDVFDPQHGLRWTAKSATGYMTTGLSLNGMYYAEGTPGPIPLRLQEARAALFDPIPASGNMDRSAIRTSMASFNGAQVNCILLADPKNASSATYGRSWDETELCVDPQSGALQVQSQIPGRYYAYDYSNSAQLGDYGLPRKVTVAETGRAVTEISVDSLTELPSADASLFVPTPQMQARGASTAMASAQKISRFIGKMPAPAGAIAQPVCVFGLVTASGKLVEAHSLQPNDPNSPAAIEAAKRLKFARPATHGARPQQHFVFIIEKFVSK